LQLKNGFITLFSNLGELAELAVAEEPEVDEDAQKLSEPGRLGINLK
jgi:hypothetical protein